MKIRQHVPEHFARVGLDGSKLDCNQVGLDKSSCENLWPPQARPPFIFLGPQAAAGSLSYIRGSLPYSWRRYEPLILHGCPWGSKQ